MQKNKALIQTPS